MNYERAGAVPTEVYKHSRALAFGITNTVGCPVRRILETMGQTECSPIFDEWKLMKRPTCPRVPPRTKTVPGFLPRKSSLFVLCLFVFLPRKRDSASTISIRSRWQTQSLDAGVNPSELGFPEHHGRSIVNLVHLNGL